MLIDRILADFFDHAGEIVAAMLVLGGLTVWLTMPRARLVSTLQEQCQQEQLLARVIREPGSHEAEPLLAVVPGGQRERLADGHWAFCRSILQTKARRETQHAEP